MSTQLEQKFNAPVGIDEVGRGCLAGPVVAAAVILDPQRPIVGLCDSKKLSAKRRVQLAQQIKHDATAWSIGRAEAREIDQINILQASLLAMKRAVMSLPVAPDWAWVDGIHYPNLSCDGECVVQGDSLIPEISAASILAKVYRDQQMQYLDALYPGYDFQRHKAYPTKLHQQGLETMGCSPVHRRSYAPVQRVMVLHQESGNSQ